MVRSKNDCEEEKWGRKQKEAERVAQEKHVTVKTLQVFLPQLISQFI